MQEFFQIIIMLVMPFIYVMLGASVFKLISYLFNCKVIELPQQTLLLAMGLICHIVGIFFLKLCGLFWLGAFTLPLCFAWWGRDYRFKLPKLSLNFSIWFFVIIALGVSLFQVVNGNIETPWKNNYGDLTFHLGVISSFLKGDNFPPQHHLFAGYYLSYPFFINLWSAALWWFNQSYESLHLIFIYQWAFLWFMVYAVFRGNRYPIIPWVLLLGGGAIYFTETPENIMKFFPFSIFISTIWVTQRAAMFGLAMLGAVMMAVKTANARIEQKDYFVHVAFAGLLLGLSPLVHVHIMLFTALFIGLVWGHKACWGLVGAVKKELFSSVFSSTVFKSIYWRSPSALLLCFIAIFAFSIFSYYVYGTFFSDLTNFNLHSDIRPNSHVAIMLAWKKVSLVFIIVSACISGYFLSIDGKECFKSWYDLIKRSLANNLKVVLCCKGLVFFIACSLVSLIFIFWLSDKTSMFKFIAGWNMQDVKSLSTLEQLKQSGLMWARNCGYILLLFLGFFLISKKWLPAIVLMFLFILANTVSFAFWDWDQIKVFVALYALVLAVWSAEESQVAYRFHFSLLILCLPAVIELYAIFSKAEMYSPISMRSRIQAEVIEKYTPQNAIIAAAPEHNSAVILSGRKMFMGYPGTLWTHGFKYTERENILKNFDKLCHCEAYMTPLNVCPHYLLWDDSAKRYWQRTYPCSEARWIKGDIYKIN